MNPFMPILVMTAFATAAVRKFRAVVVGGATEITIRGALCGGLAQEDAAIGESYPIAINGIFPALTGAAYNAGIYLMLDVEGRFITDDGSGAIAAISLEASGAADELRRILLIQGAPPSMTIQNITSAGAILAGRTVGFDDAQTDGAGEAIKGIALIAATAAGQLIPIVRVGGVNAVSGAAYAVGAQLEVDNQGRLVTLDTGAAVAVADEAAGAAGQSKRVFVK